MVVAPVAIGLLCMTIVGIPLGLVLIALYIIAFPFGGTVAAHFAGMTMRSWAGGKDEPGFGARLGWTVLGTIVLCALVIIPFIGGLIWIVAGVIGLGALVSEVFGKRQGPAAAAA